MFLVWHRKVGVVFTLSKTIISDFWTQSALTHTAVVGLLWTGPTLSSLSTRCSWGCSTNTIVIHRFIDCFGELPFSSKFSKYLHSQIVKARKLKFWDRVHLPPPVLYHLSCGTCHMSHITCNMSCVAYFFHFDQCWSKLVKNLLSNAPTPSSFYRYRGYVEVLSLIQCNN